ncbi:hypothetical protein FQN55_000060 [Onygenales sp. PD_40]|nr:hypothetical protein FQN55_000060 [Onygenales sp. PD_40]
MASILPDELVETPGMATPISTGSDDSQSPSPPKLKGHKRVLHGLQRIASSPSLVKSGRQRSSSLSSRRLGKGSMSCVSLGSSSYGQCFANPNSSQAYPSQSTIPPTSHDPTTHNENDASIRVVEADAAAAVNCPPTSVPLPRDIRPTSRGTVLISQEEVYEYISEMWDLPSKGLPKPQFEFWADMPEEIKMAILQYLSPKDLFVCARVSKSWNAMCFDGQLWARLDTSSYYTDIPGEALVKVMTAAGPFLKDLNLRGCTQLKSAWMTDGERISNACRNLENICIKDSRIDRTTLHCLLRKNPKLVHIDVSGLSSDIVNSSTMKIVAQKCPNLELLDISWCKGVDSRGLRKIITSCHQLRDLRVNELSGFDNHFLLNEIFTANSLERLILSHCSSLTDASLKILTQGIDPVIDVLTDRAIVPPRKLKHLDLSRCRGLSDAGIRALAHNVPELEGLQLSHCPNLGDEALLEVLHTTPFLSHIDLEELENLTNHFLIELSKAPCAANLEHMNLSYCEKLGDTGMLRLLKNCPRLRSLDLDNTQISDLTIIEICTQARRRGFGNSFPRPGFRIAVFDCGKVTWAGVREVLSSNTSVPRITDLPLAKSSDQPRHFLFPVSISTDLSRYSSSSGAATPAATSNASTPPPPPSPSSTILYPKEIIEMKCFYGWQMTVNEHTKRVLRGNLAAAMRLERKWADYMMANEEAGAGSAGARRRRRRAREVERMYNDEDSDDEAVYGPTGLAPLGGRRRRARSGGCVVM